MLINLNNAKAGLENVYKTFGNINKFSGIPYSGANIVRTFGQAAASYNSAYINFIVASGTHAFSYAAATASYFAFENLTSDLIGLLF